MAHTPEEIGRQVAVAARSVQAADPGALGAAMTVLLEDDNWRSYIDPADLQPHTWQDFRLFVKRRLGTSVELLVVALRHSPLAAARVEKLGVATKGTRETNDGSSFVSGTETRVGGMRRLLQERPDLARRVDREELTVHAACIEAGLRMPRVSVPVDTAASAIKALLRRFPREELLAALKDESWA